MSIKTSVRKKLDYKPKPSHYKGHISKVSKFMNRKLSAVTVGFLIAALSIAGFNWQTDLNKNSAKVLGVNDNSGYKLRYKTTTKGGIRFAGNSLGLNTYSEYQPGLIDGSIDTFMSLNNSLKDGDYPNGTTKDWKQNGSTATLDLPSGSSVLYAELVWGANFKNTEKNLNLEAEIDTPIKFTSPNGQINVSGDAITAANTPYGYIRTADVTNQVKAGGAGVYSTSGIPALLTPEEKSDNYAGWSLAVVFSDPQAPTRNLTYYTGAETVFVNKQDGNTVKVSGFGTPVQGDFEAKIFISTQEGDSDLTGDQLLFGKTEADLQAISGPNNLENNFFGAQINKYDGTLDNRGTFGDKNHPLGRSIGGNRQGFDITTVDVSKKMSNNQTEAFIKGTSKRDVYVINSLGFQIDVNAPLPKVTIKRDKPTVRVGDTITYTIDITNEGPIDAKNSILKSLIPEGTSLVPDTFKINGQNSAQNPVNPIPLNDIKPQDRLQLIYTVKVDRLPPSNVFENEAGVEYEYTQVAGQEPTKESTYSSKVVTVGIRIIGEPPVALDDQSATLKNKPVLIDVLVNDTDPDNGKLPASELDPASLEITRQPTNGNVVIKEGKTEYTPKTDFVGTDTYEYKICDKEQTCDTAEVKVTIKEPEPPVAEDDTASTKTDLPVVIEVLNNDRNPIGGIKPTDLKRIITPPSNGTVTIDNTTGKITYTPKTGFNGTDRFNYEICNSDGCDPAEVRITVSPRNIPDAKDDTSQTRENTPVDIDLPANDTDPINSLKPDTTIITKPPLNGTVELEPNTGKATYTPKIGFSGNDSFEYKICNAENECDTATARIVVRPNLAPDAINDTATTKQDAPVNIDVLKNDTDPENKLDPTTLKIIAPPKNGTVSINPSTGLPIYTPKPNFNGTDNFTYQICNTYQKCDIADVNIKVDAKAIPEAIDDSANTRINQSIEIEILKNDKNPLGLVTPDIFRRIVQSPKNGQISVDTNTGKVDYTPNTDYSGQDSFSYEICNSDGCDVAIVSIDVKGPNKPDAIDDRDQTTIGKPVTTDVLANDTDPNNSLLPSTTKVTVPPQNGTTTVDPTTGKITYLPNPNFKGADQYTYQICNTENECDTANVVLAVTTPEAPLAVPDKKDGLSNQPIQLNILDNDKFDPASPYELEIIQQPTHGQVDLNKATGTLIYIPDPEYIGIDSIVYRLCDNFDQCSSTTIDLNIQNPINATSKPGKVLGANDKILDSTPRTGGQTETIGLVISILAVLYFFFESQHVQKRSKTKSAK
jgi:uncharacterized repeat protein (TIGR01451 family)